MWERGWWTIGRVRGIPVRLHWSVPVVALLAGRLRFAPGVWLGYLVLILVHELGHATLVRRYQLTPTGVDLHGLGGECRYRGDDVSVWQESVVAWGGVLAQALLVPFGFLLAGRIEQPFVAEVVGAFAWTNVWLIGLNLLPLPPFDGWRAWRVPRLWLSSRRELRSYLRERDARLRRRRPPKRPEPRHVAELLEDAERHDRATSPLPKEIAAQVEHAMQRAVDEHRQRD